mmetsp:Transcript_27416/g.46517  ORF Transcript_27416/g.46517 Transcript_27416/m.46517 type:complete len:225 (-) Transcript_27416:362-1036(-)
MVRPTAWGWDRGVAMQHPSTRKSKSQFPAGGRQGMECRLSRSAPQRRAAARLTAATDLPNSECSELALLVHFLILLLNDLRRSGDQESVHVVAVRHTAGAGGEAEVVAGGQVDLHVPALELVLPHVWGVDEDLQGPAVVQEPDLRHRAFGRVAEGDDAAELGLGAQVVGEVPLGIGGPFALDDGDHGVVLAAVVVVRVEDDADAFEVGPVAPQRGPRLLGLIVL